VGNRARRSAWAKSPLARLPTRTGIALISGLPEISIK